MVPTSPIALTAALLPYLISAATPVCVPSELGYEVPKVSLLYHDFCTKVEQAKFRDITEMYWVPIIQFSYTSPNGTNPKCDTKTCLSSFESIVNSCQLNNHTIWGTGSLDAGCGAYNFTVWNEVRNPVGVPTTTISSIATSVALETGKASVTGSSGASGTGIRKGSGYLLGVVAGVFVWFM